MKNQHKKFQVLGHTADLRVKALGKDKKELFLNMLRGMASVIKQDTKDKAQQTIARKIEVKSIDIKALLVDFLNEVLYQSQVNKEVYNDIRFKKFSNTEIKADLIGIKVDRFEEDIKAATYHNLELEKRSHGDWEAIVIFDI